MASCRLFLLFLIASLPSYSQVANDSVKNKKELLLGEIYTSYTAHSTVERKCVDESLTGKCIKYHNDQWFSFNSEDATQLFINVSQQRCKDLFGVQLVVLRGEPCRPESYDILSCISSGTNDDFYVATKVNPYTDYLLVVDGYLEDFCTFNISLDSVARGMPPEPNLLLPEKGEIVGKVVRLQWTLPDSMQAETDRFVVYRRTKDDHRFTVRETVVVSRNTLGEWQSNYTYVDSLNDYRTYSYRVATQTYTGQQYLFATHSFRRQRARKRASIPVNYRDKTPLTIVVWDGAREKVLERLTLLSSKEKSTLQLDLSAYWDRGYRVVAVEVIDNTKKKSEIVLIDLMDLKR